MFAVARARCGGKTHEMMRAFLADDESILIVMNVHERARLIREYQVPRSRHKDIRSAAEVDLDRLRGLCKHVYIDNVEWLLREVLGPVDIRGFSFTGSAR